MADIRSYGFVRHLRGAPTLHVRHLRRGKLAHWCTILMSVAVRLLMHPRCRQVIALLA
jgi:hypothetical protein